MGEYADGMKGSATNPNMATFSKSLCIRLLCTCNSHLTQTQVENEIDELCFIEIIPDFLCPFMND